MTEISVIIASFGDLSWKLRGERRAFPSTEDQGFHEVILIYERDMTLAEVRNAGAAKATGEYLLFLDADDQLAPGFHDAMQAALAEQGPGEYLLTPAIQYGEPKYFSTPRFWPECEIETGNWMVIGTVVPRRIFELVGGWDEYELYEDWAIWAKCLREGPTIVKVPEANYLAWVSAGSRNKSSQKKFRYWRQRIGSDLWPDLYLPTTTEEDAVHELATDLRFVKEEGAPCAY